MFAWLFRAGKWRDAVLLLLMALAVGGCVGGGQQGATEEGATASGTTVGENGKVAQTPSAGSGKSTQATVTPTPTEVIQNGSPEYCRAPGHWGTWKYEPFEKHFLTWTADGRRLVFDDRATVYAIDVGEGLLTKVALANRGPVNLLLGVFGSVADGRLVFTTCVYSDVWLVPHEEFPNLPDADPKNSMYELAVVALGLEEDLQGEPTRLTRTPEALEFYPVWAPDGERFAYLIMDNSYHDFDRFRIQIASADGEVLQSLSKLRGIALAPPQWSPDGRYLAVLSSEGETERLGWVGLLRQNLYTVEMEGRQLHKISEATGLPSWSPDGGTIAFGTGGEEGSPVVLYVAGPDGANVRRLAPEEGGFPVPDFKGARERREEMGLQRDLRVSQVAWSPDGEHILVVVEELARSGPFDLAAIFVVKADGGDMWRLDLDDHLPGEFRAAWSPDGKRIAVRVDMEHTQYSLTDHQSLVVLLTVAWDGTDAQVLINRGPLFMPGPEVEEGE